MQMRVNVVLGSIEEANGVVLDVGAGDEEGVEVGVGKVCPAAVFVKPAVSTICRYYSYLYSIESDTPRQAARECYWSWIEL